MIAQHITAIVLPLLLNLFFWLGPRLHMDALFNSIKDSVVSMWQAGGVPADEIQRILKWYETTIPSINLFWIFRTLPIGISSLLFPQEAARTPLGNPFIMQVSAISLIGWIVFLTIAGWVGGGLYFRSVARLAITDKEIPPIRISRAIVQTILTSIVWSILSAMILGPVILLLVVIVQFNPFVANLLILFLSLVSMWVIVPLFFWSHGIFLKRQNFIMSIFSSVQLTRFTLPTSSMFVLTIFLLSVGLNFLWSIPPEDSWMTLVGIFGHSFVTTALLAGSFVYYRDMNIWLQAVIEKLRPNAVTKV